MSESRIVRAHGDVVAVHARVARLLDEYVRWGYAQLIGLGQGPGPEAIEAHLEAFRGELPELLGPRGRLLIAEQDDRPVGLVGLKPIDAENAEVKRMYVQPTTRGGGVGRRLLTELLADAVELGYRRVRLETAVFMVEAHALYRSMGFRDLPADAGGESEVSGIGRHLRYLEWQAPAR